MGVLGGLFDRVFRCGEFSVPPRPYGGLQPDQVSGPRQKPPPQRSDGFRTDVEAYLREMMASEAEVVAIVRTLAAQSAPLDNDGDRIVCHLCAGYDDDHDGHVVHADWCAWARARAWVEANPA